MFLCGFGCFPLPLLVTRVVFLSLSLSLSLLSLFLFVCFTLLPSVPSVACHFFFFFALCVCLPFSSPRCGCVWLINNCLGLFGSENGCATNTGAVAVAVAPTLYLFSVDPFRHSPIRTRSVHLPSSLPPFLPSSLPPSLIAFSSCYREGR